MRFASLLLVFALASPALADTVILKDGRAVVGRVSEDKNDIVVKQKLGEVRFAKDSVARIDRDDRWSELEKRQRELATGSADERYRLGVWCRENGFPDEARAAFLSTLGLDQDHQGARAALGYVREDGRWVTRDDQLRARGLVKQGERWVTPAEKALALVLAENKQKEAVEKAKKAAEEKEAQRRAKALAEREARLARIRAADEALARRQAEEDLEPRGFSTYSGYVSGCGGPYAYPGYGWSVGTYRPRVVRLIGPGGRPYLTSPVYGPSCSPGYGSGLGVGLSGSWTNKSGSFKLRFRTGF